MKKVQRKQKEGEKHGDKEKDEKSKRDSPGSDYIMDGSFGKPLNPNIPFSPDGKGVCVCDVIKCGFSPTEIFFLSSFPH